MRRLSIARSLLLALIGLTLVLALVAALEVATLYDARQDYEEELARSYAGEVGAATLLAAGVVEETVLRSSTGERRRPHPRRRPAFDRAADAALGAAAGDAPSERLRPPGGRPRRSGVRRLAAARNPRSDPPRRRGARRSRGRVGVRQAAGPAARGGPGPASATARARR